MELSSIYHIEPERIIDYQADLCITSLGNESRSTYIARMFKNVECQKVAIYDSSQAGNPGFEHNKHYFLDQGYEIVEVKSGVPDIGSILGPAVNKEINILFDYTSMPQRWYYEILKWFSEIPDDYSKATIRFTYMMAQYVEPVSVGKVKGIKEFLKSESRNGKKKNIVLVLGLGHEENVSDSIYQLVKPDLNYLFYADPPVDRRFVEKVFVNNHALINATHIRNLIAYPIRNGQHIYQKLIDTILPLRHDYMIHLIPQGPKIFSLAAMLVHLSYPDIIISYPMFSKSALVDRQPVEEPVVLEVHFEAEE